MKIKYSILLNNEEKKMIMESLILKRNRLIQNGKFTDGVDDLIKKLIKIK